MMSTGRFFIVAVVVSATLYVVAALLGIDPKPVSIVFVVAGVIVAAGAELVLKRRASPEPPATPKPGAPT
jgi:hypothetical protein